MLVRTNSHFEQQRCTHLQWDQWVHERRQMRDQTKMQKQPAILLLVSVYVRRGGPAYEAYVVQYAHRSHAHRTSHS
jgi:hypothetical protein